MKSWKSSFPEAVDALHLQPGERLEELQRGGYRIIQQERAFRFGMDSVLLADFARIAPGDTVADFGTGNGILPLLLRARGKGQQFHAFELQADMAALAERNMALNGLQTQVTVHALDVRRAAEVLPPGSVDAVICNPPYGIPRATLDTARHQGEDGREGWFRAAQRLLRGRGRMSLIYPAPRMLQLMEALEATHLAPKRFRLVYPRPDRPANLALVEAVKDGRPMLHPEPPLIVRDLSGEETEELHRIYGER